MTADNEIDEQISTVRGCLWTIEQHIAEDHPLTALNEVIHASSVLAEMQTHLEELIESQPLRLI